MPSDYLTEWEKSKDDNLEQLELFAKKQPVIKTLADYSVMDLFMELLKRFEKMGVK